MKKKIFICDDNVHILEALELVLSMTDATIASEKKSSQALSHILREKPDIFICDLSMPEITGEDLIRQIRARKEFDDMFILCISASHDANSIAINAGADHFLPKPFEIDRLLSIVKAALA
ncbi:response regulator [Sphingobacterium sp.]|uniref:response regulator n=1 Tax=Sphingobacterium sp. TaxID=341027 RepID=UPI002FDDA02E